MATKPKKPKAPESVEPKSRKRKIVRDPVTHRRLHIPKPRTHEN